MLEERRAGDADDVEIGKMPFQPPGHVGAEDVDVIVAENEVVAFAGGDAAVVSFGERRASLIWNEFPIEPRKMASYIALTEAKRVESMLQMMTENMLTLRRGNSRVQLIR